MSPPGEGRLPMRLIRCRSKPVGSLASAVEIMVVVAVLLAGCSSPDPAPPAAPTGGELAVAVDRFVDQSLSPGIRNTRAILVAVDGKTVVERYYDSRADESTNVASVTKSILSTLIGIAVSEGDLTIDQTLRELLPSYAEVMTRQVGAITVRQLLTMTAGLPADGSSDPRPSGSDWIADIVRRGTVQAPGKGFAYSSASSHLLAAILVEATGRPLLAYARERLLEPLGIDTRQAFQPILAAGLPDRVEAHQIRAYERAGFAWPRDPQGINVGYGYIKMTAEDMVKLGNLYLDQGAWEGEQLVPGSWVEDATSPAVSTVPGGFAGADYGYQWWVTSAGEYSAFAAIGYGGQIIEVVPDLRLVVAASTWIDDTTSFDSRIWETMVDIVIVPAFDPSPS
jgi:CubicO group peptidase (beta-lactamase class C family)